MKKHIYSILLAISLLNCKREDQIFHTFNTTQSVIIRKNSLHNKIYRLNIPIGINLKNNSFRNKFFIKITYKYKPYFKGIGEDLYRFKSKRWTEVKNNNKHRIYPFIQNNFSLYSWYRLDSSKQTQQQFKPYIDKMLSENKDTLHIGTVREFKSKHGELFEKLTKNDSISIQFLEGNELGERITVPVEW